MKVTLMMLTALAAVGAANAQNIGVSVDGQPVRFSGTQPKMVDNSVLVPLRGVFEQMGARVLWNQRDQEITADRDGKTIRLVIGQRYADVDGRSVQLATPARVVNGSTLVPLRFVSEALGSRVTWNPNTMMVAVSTPGGANNAGRAQPIERFDPSGTVRPDRRDRTLDREARRGSMIVLDRATVIPVRLAESLSSNESRKGDRFTSTIDAPEGTYADLPAGTKIQGRVVTATPQRGEEPGLLELSFDRLLLPDGRSIAIEGSMVSLDDKNVKRNEDGRLVATGKARDNRGVYAGYGAGAGLIVGLLGKRPLEGALLGGLLGFGLGSAKKSKKDPSNVRLDTNTRFGVRLDQDLTVERAR